MPTIHEPHLSPLHTPHTCHWLWGHRPALRLQQRKACAESQSRPRGINAGPLRSRVFTAPHWIGPGRGSPGGGGGWRDATVGFSVFSRCADWAIAIRCPSLSLSQGPQSRCFGPPFLAAGRVDQNIREGCCGVGGGWHIHPPTAPKRSSGEQ